MALISRLKISSPNDVAIVHRINRTVRMCFLLGDEPVTGNNFDHRKAWVEFVLGFGKLFSAVAGKPKVIDSTRSPRQRYNTHPRTRELLSS